ncbi:MAG: cell wall-binding repeat-containing protein [Actinomycetia bacterium]|nr:cell wall-binding repeat-containing protein [Actinomycetes bacterium]
MTSPPSVVATARRAFFTAMLVAAICLPDSAYAEHVFLDPGHGGAYPGATYAGVEEQYVNMLIASETRKVLQGRGHTVAMSRTGDVTVCTRDIPTWHYSESDDRYALYADGKTGVYSYGGSGSAIAYDDLQRRCDLANSFGADVFLSIHCNAAGTTASGTETFYNSWTDVTDAALSRRFATCVQEEVVRSAGTDYRRVDDVGYYVIRWSNMPSALLEVGFLSNPEERARLLSPAFRSRVAIGIANGIDRFLAQKPFTPREPRIGGEDRYDTSARAALAEWPDGASSVILASGEDWADALAAVPFSAIADAPVLLTASTVLPDSAAAAIRSLHPVTLMVLGGESAVASEVVRAAADAASLQPEAVRRIGGADRYATAVLIAEEVGTPSRSVTIVCGEDYADALSASAFSAKLGRPILLTARDRLSPATAEYLERHSNALTGATIVGGPAAVSEAAAARVNTMVPATRLWGNDRYATNIQVVKHFWPTGTMRPVVATASRFPDALTAGALAAERGEPLIVCGRSYLPGRTREWIMHESDRIGAFTMIGGTSALSTTLEWEFAKARRYAQ